MQTPVIEQEIVEQEVPVCRHHWVIESPHGATSLGRCKRCSEVREFRNSAADTLWEGDPMSSINKMGGNRPIIREKRAPVAED
ncbi:MAG: hypothetical protein GEU75_17620 [Dehalococcoidia bacterium]|nr:hypothetical protein [Dehalococcoidia bacterium]